MRERKSSLTVSGPAFSVVRQARGGGGGGGKLRGLDAKNQGQHQPIEMKLWMSHYSHKSKALLMQNLRLIAFPVLEIWCHKISLGRRERVIKFGYLPLENGINFRKWVFMSRIVLLDPKLTLPPPPPHVNFSNFQAEEIFSFSKFLGGLDEKRAAATLLIGQFC